MKTENLIDLWLRAEEELRKGNDNKCLDLKHKFNQRYNKLKKNDQNYVKDYLISIGA
tara:strand:+ start:3860 stop:4030 length:171 start_codon:yes stop_codon:yes gene_type:complete